MLSPKTDTLPDIILIEEEAVLRLEMEKIKSNHAVVSVDCEGHDLSRLA